MYEDQVESADEELKRADHLVYVSLKYTRTCDVMKNAIKRMISAYDLAMAGFLESMRKNKKISDLPASSKERVALVKSLLGVSVRKYLVLYKLLKDVEKAECTAVEEFRKNVTLRITKPKALDIKVDDLNRYLGITKEFVAFIKQKAE